MGQSTGGALRTAVAWILLTAGLILALVGLNDVVTSYFSQRQAAAAYVKPGGSAAESMKTARPKLPDGFVGRLSIPRLKVSWFVVDEKRPRDLRRGPGVIPGSVRVGAPGNCIIAGHRDLHFRALKDVRVGDEVLLDTGTKQLSYRITSTRVVSQTNTAALDAAAVKDKLTLVTCYPFYYVGNAPKRFIVEANIDK